MKTPRSNRAVLLALLLCAFLVVAAPAAAAPQLGISLQLDSKPTSVPLTHSDERAFYRVTVKNTASSNPSVGDELTCKNSTDQWFNVPSEANFSYRWLRNGAAIPGETAKTYVVSAADEGASIQCEVTGTNPNTQKVLARTRVATVSSSSNLIANVITVTGAGTLTSGSKLVTGIPPAQGVLNDFQVGQEITGTGIPAETQVAAVSAGTLELSKVATASGLQSLSAGAQPFAVGQMVQGPGIPDGTEVIAVKGLSIELSANATASASGAVVEAVSPVSTSAVAVSLPPASIEPQSAPPPPSPAVDPRVFESRPEIQDAGGDSLIFDDDTRICKVPTNWTSGTSFTYQWLRNGTPIPGETSPNYTPVEDKDRYALLQCEVLGKSGSGVAPTGGITVSVSRTKSWAVTQTVSPSHEGFGALGFSAPNNNPISDLPATEFSNTASGLVEVDLELPGGEETFATIVKGVGSGEGWACTKLPPSGAVHASAHCERTGSLLPQTSLPPIELIERPGHDAPDALVTKATVSGGGAPDPASTEDTIMVGPAIPFGFQAFETEVLDASGDDFTQAGGHPFSAGASLEFTSHVKAEAVNSGIGTDPFRANNGSPRVIRTDVPPGFVGNPLAAPEHCESMAQVTATPTKCPAGSVVGGISLLTSEKSITETPIYAMEPEAGTPAQFAFSVAVGGGLAIGFTLTPELRADDGYAISLVSTPAPKNPELFVADAKLCSFGGKLGLAPSGASEMIGCRKASDAGAFEKPFLTLPSKCGDKAATTTKILADSWEAPGKYSEDEFSLPALEGCSALSFEPTLKARPTTNAADSPTGLEVDLEIPQGDEDPEGTATAQLKKAVVTLPEGLVVNPSGANGLDACAPSQIKLGTNDPISCPNASKVGSVQVETPILDHPLPGSLYVATPHDNPFNSLLALYLVIDSPKDGLLIKLPGLVDPNPSTGQLKTTFDQNPQAPVSDIKLKIKGGATAPLRTPTICKKYETTSSLTPWSAPESGPPATPKDSWSINRGPGGTACAASQPNAPAFEAGTASPIAAAYTPFTVKLRREDGTQTFSSVSITPPPGLLGKLAGIPYCPEAALAAAAAKSGKAEQASPSCPLASRVGSVVAGAGAGPAPYYASGSAYLSGPYKGAPLSLAIVTPAVAGPFDLGTVVVRTALNVDPETAKITAVSDPLPQILQGIPLDIRSVAISMDRPDFILNPTSCDPMAVTGQAISPSGNAAALNNRFQVGECSRLGFKPNLQIKLKGATKRTGHPALTATLDYPKGAYANIASASVALPHSEFLDQAHIKTICTRVQFAADQCPSGAIYGKATATTPLLDQPLTGPVYLRSSSNPLPDLVVDLRGQIHVALVGRIDSKNGGIRTTFASVPDAPVAKFTLQMQGGKKGLLINSRDICKSTNRATAEFSAQNGKELVAKPVLGAKCPKARKGKQKHKPRR